MDKHKKVIKGLECCIEASTDSCPRECPYYLECLTHTSDFMFTAIRDALELLKEQQETIVSLQHTIDALNKGIAEQPEIVRCKDCKHWDKTTREEGNDCISGPWEDAECEVFRDWDHYGDLGENFRRTNGDWFCADGVRR